MTIFDLPALDKVQVGKPARPLMRARVVRAAHLLHEREMRGVGVWRRSSRYIAVT